ncbi:MAG: class I SAM-dependent methyltransferase [Myxococcales bacterium]|nr:class I SAM-dependent methyltransferase [Myxococcales bacterium]
MTALPRRLACSQHLSFFHRRDAVFLYHDVWGYLLEMSSDLVDFVRGFGTGIPVGPALAAAPFSMDEGHEFAQILMGHAVLLDCDTGRPTAEEELQSLQDGYPVKGVWRVALTEADGTVVVVQGRNLPATRHLITLTSQESQLWRSIDGERNCRQLAAMLATGDEPDAPKSPLEADTSGELLDWVCDRVAHWTHSDRQWTRVSSVPMSLWQNRKPPYLTSTMPYPRLTTAGTHDPYLDLDIDGDGDADVVQNEGYHTTAIANADAQFEDVETTLSHLFRDPHPALADRSWAHAMRDALIDKGLWTPETKDVIEIGGGLGWFAKRMVESCSEAEREGLSYQVLDIAPTLQAAQRARLGDVPEAAIVTSDAEQLDLPDASVDLAISNEVIADLRTAWLNLDDVIALREAGQTWGDTAGLTAVLKYELPVTDAPERFAINLGAMRLIERLADVLKPGGAAILTEFGHRFRYPVESTHLDHPEFSIHFGHLAHVAEKCGLTAEVVELPELVGLMGDASALRSTQTWWANLRALAASRDVTLDKRAWTRGMLEAVCEGKLPLDDVELLQWQPLGERTMGLVPSEFLALIIRRPTAGA